MKTTSPYLQKPRALQSLVLLSDSTGDLGERFIRAMITQFPDARFSFRVFSFIKDEIEVGNIFESLRDDHPIIFHTTLVAGLKRCVEALAEKYHCPVYDLTGGAMEFLQRASGLQSVPKPAALHELNQEYEQRIKSLEFTVDHDDGLGEPTLRAADIILLGVSRTSKTPTSIYLAYKGFRVANIPLVKGLPVPDFLHDSTLHLAGLIIEPYKLLDIRLRRAHEDRAPRGAYTDLDAIRDELRWSRSIFNELACPVIDVTHHAVEETAALVLKALKRR